MLYASNTFVSYNYPLKEADVVFLGIPFASTSVSKPALYGPLMIRESLKLMEDFVNGNNIFGSLKVCDLGDIEVVPGSYELTAQRIRETVQDIREANRKAFLIFIGGEHLVTLPIAEALKPKTIVQLDAHADCRADYLGNKYMHQTWAHHASKFSDIVQIGVTSLSREEDEYLSRKKNITQLSALKFLKKPPAMKKPVHLSIDIDVLEGAATGLPEGRLMLEQVLDIVAKVPCDSMDITEIADDRLPSVTGFRAAKLILHALANRIKSL